MRFSWNDGERADRHSSEKVCGRRRQRDEEAYGEPHVEQDAGGDEVEQREERNVQRADVAQLRAGGGI